MIANNLGLIELLATFGILFIFFVWQFVSLDRDKKKAAAEKLTKAKTDADAKMNQPN